MELNLSHPRQRERPLLGHARGRKTQVLYSSFLKGNKSSNTHSCKLRKLMRQNALFLKNQQVWTQTPPPRKEHTLSLGPKKPCLQSADFWAGFRYGGERSAAFSSHTGPVLQRHYSPRPAHVPFLNPRQPAISSSRDRSVGVFLRYVDGVQ